MKTKLTAVHRLTLDSLELCSEDDETNFYTNNVVVKDNLRVLSFDVRKVKRSFNSLPNARYSEQN